jgi:L-asparaginase II
MAFERNSNLPQEGYVKIDHAVQREIASVLEAFTGVKHDAGNCGIDGCSIPTYAVPLDRLAVAYAKFGVADDASPERAAAMVRIRDACFAHPEMVAGTGAMDSEIMAALPGRALVKSGAEGVYVASLPERGLGIALKCHDGATRAAQVAIAATLESLLELDENESTILKRFANPQLHNWNRIHVGQLRMEKRDN